MQEPKTRIERTGRFLLGFSNLLIALAGLLPLQLKAESDIQSQVLSFRRWGREEGLANDTVTALLQTHDGYLWVGTAGGLDRFDGNVFDPVRLPVRFAEKISGVTSLCEDDSHRLWIGTQNDGLFWIAEGKVHAFDDGDRSLHKAISSLAADNAGQLWVGTGAGLFQVNLATLQRIVVPGLTNELISSVHAARSGTIWITSRNGMSRYKNGQITPVDFDAENLGRTLEFMGLYEDHTGSLWAFGDTYLVNLSEGKRFNYFRTGDASSFRIWTLCEGRSGQLWIGTSGQGLFAFSDGKFRPLALRENRLPSDVRAICEDRQGNLWLGTFGGGLIRLRVRQEQIFDTRSGLPEETASCIGVDAAGGLWAGYHNGGLYSSAGPRFSAVSSQRLISSLALAPDGSAWIGTSGNGLFHLAGGQEVRYGSDFGLASENITALACTADNSVLIGTSAGVVHRLKTDRLETFGRQEGLSGAPVSALLADRAGIVCAGTGAGELFRLQKGRFTQIEAHGLAGAPVSALQEDDRDRLWIATEGRGMACEEKNRVTVWDVNNGLPDNNINCVLPETNGVVWVATGKGIFRVEDCWPDGKTRSVVCRLMVENELVQRVAVGYPTAVKSGDGRLWFITPGRVVTLDPQKLQINSAPLPVYIKQVLVNDVELAMPADAEPLRLPPRLSSMEIRFAALNLGESESVRFQHKLEGFESGWVEGGAERKVRYGRLPYGSYNFHLRARNANGLWGDSQAKIALVYPVPVWRSAGALAAYGLAAICIVVWLVWLVSHRRLREKLERLGRQQAMQKERMRIAQDMHDEVGSKLTKIAYLSDIMALRVQGSESEGFQSIASTSRDLLQSLDEIVWAVNPQNDSLERLAAYLGHFATEYLQDTSVELELDLPGGLPEYPLSAETRHNLFVAFEEALANALKHSGATKIQVSMQMNAGSFSICVHDNGKGFASGTVTARSGGGNGLANMRTRLGEIGGVCRIDSPPGGGTIVCLDYKLSATQPA